MSRHCRVRWEPRLVPICKRKPGSGSRRRLGGPTGGTSGLHGLHDRVKIARRTITIHTRTIHTRRSESTGVPVQLTLRPDRVGMQPLIREGRSRNRTQAIKQVLEQRLYRKEFPCSTRKFATPSGKW